MDKLIKNHKRYLPKLKKKNPKKKNPNTVLKYSGMVSQMAGAIFIGLFLGKKLDAYFETQKPYFMLLLIIVFLSAVFFSIFKQLNEDNK